MDTPTQAELRDRLVIRPEGPEDEAAVAELTDAAFGIPEGRAEAVETELLRGLRADGDLIGELTLVAELDRRVVGQVACSAGTLDGRPCVGLGPISITPPLQRRGIGAVLVSAVVATAERRADPVLVLLGDPEYYGFFGFRPAAELGIDSPEPAWGRHFQAKPLRAWRPELAGPFVYAPAFARIAG